MIAKAQVKDGGLFIPDVELDLSQINQQEVKIQFEILEKKQSDNIFEKAAGIMKYKNINPVEFQSAQRSEWDG